MVVSFLRSLKHPERCLVFFRFLVSKFSSVSQNFPKSDAHPSVGDLKTICFPMEKELYFSSTPRNVNFDELQIFDVFFFGGRGSLPLPSITRGVSERADAPPPPLKSGDWIRQCLGHFNLP